MFSRSSSNSAAPKKSTPYGVGTGHKDEVRFNERRQSAGLFLVAGSDKSLAAYELVVCHITMTCLERVRQGFCDLLCCTTMIDDGQE